MDNGNAQRFIQDFYSINGISIKDRQHNLYQLFRKYSKLDSAELDTICVDLHPKTHLEKIFRIDFLIYFKRIDELYKEFQSGDNIVICKVAKCEWFFKQSFEKHSVDNFVNSVLPTMSYSTRMKILKRFNGTEERNDAIFDALKQRYGVFKSLVWLTKCSSKKIKEIIEENPHLRLTENQLKRVFDKDKALVTFYYDKYGPDGNHKSLLALIARKDPDMIIELLKKHKILGLDLGRRNTRHFIATKKKEVLEKPEEFFDLLNQGALRRKLGADSTVLVEKLFPKKIEDIGCFYDKSYHFLLHFPPKVRFETFKTVYNRRFNEKFEENPDAIHSDLLKYGILEMIPDKFEREKYALIKYNKEQDNDLLKYVTPERCLKEFTSKMSKMGMRQRATFIGILTECCVFNKDVETLLKVCELVSNRFKNDDYQLHLTFVNAMHDPKFIRLLGEDHFKHIFKIFANDTQNRIYRKTEFHFGYFEYLLRNNKPIKEVLFKAPKELENLDLDYFTDIKLFRQVLLELLQSPVPKELEGCNESDDATSYEATLMRCCIEYGKKCPNDRFHMLDYETTRKAVYKSIKYNWMDYYGNTNYVKYLLRSPVSNAEFTQLAETFFKEMKTVENTKAIILNLLRKHPQLVEKHFDRFLEKFREAHFKQSAPLWMLVKKYSHLGLDRKVVDFCATKLNSEENVAREDYICPLSILMEPQSYRDLIKRFIPEEAKVDMEDAQQKEKYSIQSKIAWSLAHFERPSSVLPLVLEFCKGDFLKYALRPLYGNMYRLEEEKTGEYIEKLNKVDAISVKKHALYLCCEICDEKTVLETLKTPALPTLLPCLRYLKKNPSEECWKLVEMKLNKLTKTDEPLFEIIEKLGVPEEFTGRFFEVMWKVFARCNVKKYNSCLLKKLNKKTIKQVSESFTNDLILNHLFESEEIDDFLVLLLLHNDQRYWYENFLISLENIKGKHTFPVKISSLIKKFYGGYLDGENETNLDLINRFAGDFMRIFDNEKFFEECVIFELIKHKGETIENFAEFVLEFQSKLVKKYGDLIVNQFHSILETVAMNSIVNDKEHLNFCIEVLKRAQHKTDYLLLISLLPNQVPPDSDDNSKYTAVVDSLKSVNDLLVKIGLNNYFRTIS